MAVVLSVNLAVPESIPTREADGLTGINKQPATGPVLVRPPGPQKTGLGSGLVGDRVFFEGHGGDAQAVYAYAREDYEWWEAELGRELPAGRFGENLTTAGVDVSGALVGERWRIGPDVVLQATFPRIPCATFQAKMAEPHWVKRFTARGHPGTYLSVVESGEIRAGDEVTLVHRPAHDVTIADAFRAWTTEPALLPRLVDLAELPEHIRDGARRRLARAR